MVAGRELHPALGVIDPVLSFRELSSRYEIGRGRWYRATRRLPLGFSTVGLQATERNDP